jgi:hypothetical protein
MRKRKKYIIFASRVESMVWGCMRTPTEWLTANCKFLFEENYFEEKYKLIGMHLSFLPSLKKFFRLRFEFFRVLRDYVQNTYLICVTLIMKLDSFYFNRIADDTYAKCEDATFYWVRWINLERILCIKFKIN